MTGDGRVGRLLRTSGSIVGHALLFGAIGPGIGALAFCLVILAGIAFDLHPSLGFAEAIFIPFFVLPFAYVVGILPALATGAVVGGLRRFGLARRLLLLAGAGAGAATSGIIWRAAVAAGDFWTEADGPVPVFLYATGLVLPGSVAGFFCTLAATASFTGRTTTDDDRRLTAVAALSYLGYGPDAATAAVDAARIEAGPGASAESLLRLATLRLERDHPDRTSS